MRHPPEGHPTNREPYPFTTLNVNALSGFGAGTYRLFNYTGTLTDNGLLLGSLPAGFAGAVITSIDHQVNLSTQAVPEPSSLALSTLAAAAMVFWLRKQRAVMAQSS